MDDKSGDSQDQVSRLREASYNPRKITKDELRMLAKSMAEFGDLSGVVRNRKTDQLVGGHQRLKVFDKSWPIVITARYEQPNSVGTVAEGYIDSPWGRWTYREVDWDEDREKAANLAANKGGGDWDIPKLKPLLVHLEGILPDIEVTGFNLDDLENLLDRSSEEDQHDNEVPQLGAGGPHRVKLGDVWACGDHLVLCGDSTDPASYSKLGLDKERAHMVFTDPPYRVSYEAKSGKHEVIMGDRERDDDLVNKLLLPAFKAMSQFSVDTAAFYIWHASSTREDFAFAIKSAGLMERQYLIWAKQGIVLGHSDYRWAHEPAMYCSKAGFKQAFYGDRAQPTIWRASISRSGQSSTLIGPGIVLLDGHGGAMMITTKVPREKKVRRMRVTEGGQVMLQQDGGPSADIWEVAHEPRAEAGLHPTMKPVELAVRAINNSSKPGEIVLDPFGGSGTTMIAAEKLGRRARILELDPLYASVEVLRYEKFSGKKAILVE